MPFFVSKGGQTFGPHEPGEIAVFLETGVFLPGDYVWREGWGEWRTIASALADGLSGAPSAGDGDALSADIAHPSEDNGPIPSDIEIIGTLKLPAERTVTCKVEGEIVSPSTVIIARGVRVKALIKAKSVIIFGTVEGTVQAEERAVLKGSSTLHGDIHAARVLVEEGATFNGKSHVRSWDPCIAATEETTSHTPSNADAKSPARPA